MADASRCAKKEVVLVQLATHGMICTPPLQILPDQVKTHDADAAVEKATAVLTKSRPARGATDGKVELEATKLYGLAIVQSLLAVLPYSNFSVYIPSALDFLAPGMQKLWAPAPEHWYYWDGHSAPPISKWSLCDELRRLYVAAHTTQLSPGPTAVGGVSPPLARRSLVPGRPTWAGRAR